MSLTLTVNIFSLTILFYNQILDNKYLLIIIIIIFILIDRAISIIYKKERKERIREKYKDESRESRQRGVVKVVVYEVLSLAFLIFTLSMLSK